MKSVARIHPLKPIHLSFKMGKQAKPFEVEALKKYRKAHDETWKRRITYIAERDKLLLLQAEMAELSYEMFDLGEQLEVFEEALGFSERDETNITTLGPDYDINLLFERIEEHNRAMQELHTHIVEAATRYNKEVSSLYEDDFLIDPMYFDILHEVYRRYDEVEVDTVSLDKDHQDFLEAYAEVKRQHEDYMQVGQRVFDSYADLLDDAEELYRRAEAVQDGIDAMTDDEDGINRD